MLIVQAAMKVAVSSLLLSFSAFWYVESVKAISDLLLIPLFVIFFTIVYTVSSHGIHAANTRDN